MDPIQIAPGLTLTEAQYDVAAAGIAAHAPDLAPLTWAAFVRPSGWWLVPDKDGQLSKAELVLRQDPERTVKINLWHLPDVRDNKPRPHSHPWAFASQILTGGYSETRYTYRDGQVEVSGLEHTQGTANEVDRQMYHEVTALHTAPGATMTLMVCGPGERGAWGYLDPDTGHHTQPETDLTFPDRLRALNPHQP